MPGPDFFQTPMGRSFYDGTMPALVKAAERIANGLERIADQQDIYARFDGRDIALVENANTGKLEIEIRYPKGKVVTVTLPDEDAEDEDTEDE